MKSIFGVNLSMDEGVFPFPDKIGVQDLRMQVVITYVVMILARSTITAACSGSQRQRMLFYSN
jgi:hypothetical protein